MVNLAPVKTAIANTDHHTVNYLALSFVYLGSALELATNILGDPNFTKALPAVEALLPATSPLKAVGQTLIAIGPLMAVIRGYFPRNNGA